MKTILQLYESLPEAERLLVDIFRQLVIGIIPDCKEKFSWGVPSFYRNRSICIIWPASVPGGGFQDGVLFGFSKGNMLKDPDNYLHHGTNRQVYYRIFKEIDDIDFDALEKLLLEADALDRTFK
jgi:hypothetical protein